MVDLKLLAVMLFEIALYGNIYLILGSITSYLITGWVSLDTWVPRHNASK